MKKAITILCAVLFSACTQTAQTETAVTTEITTEVITETAVTTASQTVTETTTEALQTETASETVISSASTTETTTEAATVTTTETLDEERQKILDEMPDIVFVMSHHYNDTNILGFYVTKTGEIKMYDFRNIAPDETYEIPDVYDRLEEATCERLILKEGFWYSENGLEKDGIIEKDELNRLSVNDLIDLYLRLKLAENAIYYIEPEVDDMPSKTYYGIRNADDNKKQIVVLGGVGSNYLYTYEENNKVTEELLYEIFSLFPYIPVYE